MSHTELKGTLEYAKLSIESFGAEVTLTTELIDQMLNLIGAYEECRDDALILHKQVEELQKIIETAVMFLQSNELHVKAEQIKAMVKKGLNHEIR